MNPLVKKGLFFALLFLTLWQSAACAAIPKESEESPSLSEVGRPLLAWFEKSIPVFVDLSAKQMRAHYLPAAREKKIASVCTDEELRKVVLDNIESGFAHEVGNLVAKIHADGIAGSGIVRLGRWNLRVASRVGVKLVEDRVKAQIHEARVETIPVPRYILRMLERRVNRAISQKASHLKVKKIQFQEGSAFVIAELS